MADWQEVAAMADEVDDAVDNFMERAMNRSAVLEQLAQAADRLSFEVQYFDQHKPDECAVVRAAVMVDGLLEQLGFELDRDSWRDSDDHEHSEAVRER